jgi:hypothetical protein
VRDELINDDAVCGTCIVIERFLAEKVKWASGKVSSL